MKKKKLTARLEKTAVTILQQAIVIDQQKNIIQALQTRLLDLVDPMLNVGPSGELLPAKPIDALEARYDDMRSDERRRSVSKGASRDKRAKHPDLALPTEKSIRDYQAFAKKAVIGSN